MNHTPEPAGAPWLDAFRENFYRMAASGLVSPRFYVPELPAPGDLPARTGPLRLEIVSHCWNYAHLQAYQLSSLVLHPPVGIEVRMTVYHSPEDRKTVRLLEHFATRQVPGVTWDWRPLERGRLLRRAIGRNEAAKATKADWVWFTDCDVLFLEGCLTTLAQRLQGRTDRLLFPQQEHCTRLLREDDPVLLAAADEPGLVRIDPAQFEPVSIKKAVGPLQVVHGDIARRFGYCDAIPFYQQPVPHWRKTYEDRALRWLLRTQGEPIDVPGVYRIKHLHKGRYQEGGMKRVRRGLRQLQSLVFGRARGEGPRKSGAQSPRRES